jgi:hypothetical protein
MCEGVIDDHDLVAQDVRIRAVERDPLMKDGLIVWSVGRVGM